MDIKDYYKELENHNFFYYREWNRDYYLKWRNNEIRLILVSFESEVHSALFDSWSDCRIMNCKKPILEDYIYE